MPSTKTKPMQPMTAPEIEAMTKKLITDHPSFEFIYISTRGHFGMICNSIYDGLFNTRKVERKCLEIGLHLDCTVST